MRQVILDANEDYRTTEIVRDPEHSDGVPTVDDTGIRVINVASADEHSGYSPDEIVEFYPVLTLEDVHTVPAYYDAHVEGFGDIEPESGTAPARGLTPTSNRRRAMTRCSTDR